MAVAPTQYGAPMDHFSGRRCSIKLLTNGGELWWPQFRGPNSSGLGGGKPPIHFGPGQNVQWKTAVGSGLSSPIVWAERVFLTEFDPASQKPRHGMHRSAQGSIGSGMRA